MKKKKKMLFGKNIIHLLLYIIRVYYTSIVSKK